MKEAKYSGSYKYTYWLLSLGVKAGEEKICHTFATGDQEESFKSENYSKARKKRKTFTDDTVNLHSPKRISTDSYTRYTPDLPSRQDQSLNLESWAASQSGDNFRNYCQSIPEMLKSA